MSTQNELCLNFPFELEGVNYDKLKVSSFAAIASFECHNAPRVIMSLATVFGVPRRVIRHLHPDDAHRAGDLIRDLLDESARSIVPMVR